MATISTNEFRSGAKIEIEGQPYTIVSNEFVKPGKGQAFNRVKLRQLMTGRTIERTIKSGEKFDVADVNETKMRMLYEDADGAVFMDDKSFEQHTVPHDALGDTAQWLKEDLLYDIVFYKSEPVGIEPPTFMDLLITETDPGVRGDTASGKVMKPAKLETGAKVQVPIFIDQEEIITVDTRTGEYVSRAKG